MTELLFGVLLQGLTLWKDKNATKYIDEVYKLQKDFLEEYKKPRSVRSNQRLDEIEEKLHVLGKIFINGKTSV